MSNQKTENFERKFTQLLRKKAGKEEYKQLENNFKAYKNSIRKKRLAMSNLVREINLKQVIPQIRSIPGWENVGKEIKKDFSHDKIKVKYVKPSSKGVVSNATYRYARNNKGELINYGVRINSRNEIYDLEVLKKTYKLTKIMAGASLVHEFMHHKYAKRGLLHKLTTFDAEYAANRLEARYVYSALKNEGFKPEEIRENMFSSKDPDLKRLYVASKGVNSFREHWNKGYKINYEERLRKENLIKDKS